MAVAKSPPGPKGKWLGGNLLEFRRDKLGFLLRIAREYGPMAQFQIAGRKVVLVSEPELIEQVLLTQNRKFAKGFGFKVLRGVLGDGLVTSEGELWLRQRRLMQPAFQRSQVESYAPIILAQCERKLAEWQSGPQLDLHAEMMDLTLAIAAKALLDVELDERFSAMGHSIDLLMEDFVYRMGSALPIPRRWPTPWNLRVRRAVERFDDLIYGIIAERRKALADYACQCHTLPGAPADHAGQHHTQPGNDLLTRLMQAQDASEGGMSDRQLRDELITLLSAGHETTANALSWTWYLLARHPAAAARLAAELRDVLGERPPAAADVPRLEFTEHVVLEAMRLYPPAFTMGRLATEPVELGGYQLSAGTTCLLSQWVTHRDERFFERPEEFRPERWENDLARRLPKFAYFPFGGGPRVCIGNSLAMLEMVLVVARIAQRCRFELVSSEPVEPWPAITLRPRHGLPVICRAADIRSFNAEPTATESQVHTPSPLAPG